MRLASILLRQLWIREEQRCLVHRKTLVQTVGNFTQPQGVWPFICENMAMIDGIVMLSNCAIASAGNVDDFLSNERWLAIIAVNYGPFSHEGGCLRDQ